MHRVLASLPSTCFATVGRGCWRGFSAATGRNINGPDLSADRGNVGKKIRSRFHGSTALWLLVPTGGAAGKLVYCGVHEGGVD